MSSRREVLIRIALLQRKTLIETKNRTLKYVKWHSSTVRSKKNVAVLTEDGAFALFFRPHPGGFDSSRAPSPGNLPFKAKKSQCRGSARGGGGWSQLGLTDALWRNSIDNVTWPKLIWKKNNCKDQTAQIKFRAPGENRTHDPLSSSSDATGRSSYRRLYGENGRNSIITTPVIEDRIGDVPRRCIESNNCQVNNLLSQYFYSGRIKELFTLIAMHFIINWNALV